MCVCNVVPLYEKNTLTCLEKNWFNNLVILNLASKFLNYELECVDFVNKTKDNTHRHGHGKIFMNLTSDVNNRVCVSITILKNHSYTFRKISFVYMTITYFSTYLTYRQFKRSVEIWIKICVDFTNETDFQFYQVRLNKPTVIVSRVTNSKTFISMNIADTFMSITNPNLNRRVGSSDWLVVKLVHRKRCKRAIMFIWT